MNLEKYLCLRENYPLPEQMESAGHVHDPKTGHVLAVGIMTHRKLYSEIGYVCDADAPDELHACVCSMMELVKGMALIKTALLTPEMIYAPICEEEQPTEELVYYANMALCALNQALKGYLSEN